MAHETEPVQTAEATPSPSDEEVIARVQGGEIEAFEVLMRRYNQRLYRAVRAILREDDETVDVMQEAYVSAFTHLGDFSGRSQ